MDEFANSIGKQLAGARNENHVSLHVGSSLVVLAVGDLPAEVRDKKSRVKDPTSHIVDQGRVRESTVTALVGDNPEASAEEALHGAVQAP